MKFFSAIFNMIQYLQYIDDENFYIIFRVLTRTTQPAHLIALLIATFVLSILWPDLVSTPAEMKMTEEPLSAQKTRNKYSILMYLGVFATHFGSQMWMTFVSGN